MASRCCGCCKDLGQPTHLILSEAAGLNLGIETDYTLEQVRALASVVYSNKDVGAAVASGSFRTRGMIVAPCTIKTLSAIANSFTYNLVARAADVQLKEGRKLVLLVRETPLHKGHLDLMRRAADCGAVILPPMPAFYHRPADDHGPHSPDHRQGARPGRHRARPVPALERPSRPAGRGKRRAQAGVAAFGVGPFPEQALMRPANPFWRFSLRTWRIPGVQRACLALQDQCGADVNLLLLCGWTGRSGRELDQRSLRLAIDCIGAWQSDVVAPVRLARRGLKQQRAAAQAVALPFRQRLQALELELERAEQDLLADLVSQWPPPVAAAPPRQAIAANLAGYLRLLATPAGPDALAQLACIIDACSGPEGGRR